MLLAKEEGIRRLEREVEELRTRVQALEKRRPPEDWTEAHQDLQTTMEQEKTKPKQKKPWWQA